MQKKIDLAPIRGTKRVRPTSLLVQPNSPIALLVYRKTAFLRFDLDKAMFIDQDIDPKVQKTLNSIKRKIVTQHRREVTKRNRSRA